MNFTKVCRKVIAVGRNYADHAKELGNAVPTKPILFLKPPSSFLLQGEGPIEIPPGCTNLHHEVELGIVIEKAGRDVSIDDSMSYVKGYFLGLDMTARELQDAAKKGGLPWSISKGYDTFSPVGKFIPKEKIPDPSKVRLWCKVNGVEKQNGTTDMMLFPVPEIISYISTIFAYEEFDTIYTGTPAGVGPVKNGDTIECGIVYDGETIETISFKVAPRPAKL